MPESLPSSVEELAGLVIELRVANAGLREVIAAQAAELAGLKQRLGKDSATSNKPPSSDSPYRKPERRSSRRSTGRDPGKQQGCAGLGDAAGRQPERDRHL